MAKERALPHDVNAEAGVLSAMMIDEEAAGDAIIALEEKHFFDSRHKIIFTAIKNMYEAGTAIDVITIMDKLNALSLMEKAGGKDHLLFLMDMVVSGSHLQSHITIVREKYELRNIIINSRVAAESAYDGTKSSTEIKGFVESVLYDNNSSSRDFVSMQEGIQILTKSIEDKMLGNKPHRRALFSGIQSVDDVTGGFRPGQLIVLAGLQSHGKTAYAITIAANMAKSYGLPIAIFSLEMDKEEVFTRIVAAAASINTNVIDGPDHTPSSGELDSIMEGFEQVSNYPIYVDDSPFQSSITIKSKAKRLKAKYPNLGGIFIDYLQLMSSDKKAESLRVEIGNISRSLKILAKELEVPIFILSQFKRILMKPGETIPRDPVMSDLRETGAIESDADKIIFVHNKYVITKNPEYKNKVKIIVEKNRGGDIGYVYVGFTPETTHFFTEVKQNDERC